MRRKNLLALLIACASLTACSTLPDAPTTRHDAAVSAATEGRLAAAHAVLTADLDPAMSRMLLLEHSRDALDWRLALIDNATRSIDMQYFIWANDAVGAILMDRLVVAADRGVEVRVLLDDLSLLSQSGVKSQDLSFAAISAHPNISLRLFNPGKFRDGSIGIAGNFMVDFKGFNRRMHNKLIVADGLFGLAGGRNLANEYFGLSETYNFLDLDVVFIGDAVEDAQAGFDEYWNNERAFPASALAEASPEDFQLVVDQNREFLESQKELLSSFLGEESNWDEYLETLVGKMQVGKATFMQDSPDDNVSQSQRLYALLSSGEFVGGTNVKVATAYLIPSDGMIESIRELREAGVDVRLLTNSLASNNHTAASSHYATHRDAMLDAGGELFEFKHQPSADARAISDVAPVRGEFIGLHMKTYVTTDERCFVGSLNFDPRAIDINTENGLVIQSDELCGELSEFIEILMSPDNAWQVTRDEDGEMRWTSSDGTVSEEPARAENQRFTEWMFRQLPIEDQL